MKVNWVIKYYFVMFLGIFSLVYYIEKSEPQVNWSLYPDISQNQIKSLIKDKNCAELQNIFLNEYDTNYTTNFFGFYIRKDRMSIRGLNLLKYLEYHLTYLECT